MPSILTGNGILNYINLYVGLTCCIFSYKNTQFIVPMGVSCLSLVSLFKIT